MTARNRISTIGCLTNASMEEVVALVNDCQGDAVALLELSLVKSSLAAIDRHLQRLNLRLEGIEQEKAEKATEADK